MALLPMTIEDSYDLDLSIRDDEHVVLILIASFAFDTFVVDLLFVEDVLVLILKVHLKVWLL